MNPIRLAIVDDHPAIGLAIQAAVAGAIVEDSSADPERDIRIVGTARTPEDGIVLVSREGEDRPDVVLCDIQLRVGTDGLRVIEAAGGAGCRAIVFTSFDRSSLLGRHLSVAPPASWTRAWRSPRSSPQSARSRMAARPGGAETHRRRGSNVAHGRRRRSRFGSGGRRSRRSGSHRHADGGRRGRRACQDVIVRARD